MELESRCSQVLLFAQPAPNLPSSIYSQGSPHPTSQLLGYLVKHKTARRMIYYRRPGRNTKALDGNVPLTARLEIPPPPPRDSFPRCWVQPRRGKPMRPGVRAARLLPRRLSHEPGGF